MIAGRKAGLSAGLRACAGAVFELVGRRSCLGARTREMKRRFLVAVDAPTPAQTETVTSIFRDKYGWWHWIGSAWLVTDQKGGGSPRTRCETRFATPRRAFPTSSIRSHMRSSPLRAVPTAQGPACGFVTIGRSDTCHERRMSGPTKVPQETRIPGGHPPGIFELISYCS